MRARAKLIGGAIFAMATLLAAGWFGGAFATHGDVPVEAQATCASYRLELELPRTTWAARDAIEGKASLSYLGSGMGHWTGSGMGPVGFEYKQLDGKIDVGGFWTDDLVSHPIDAASPFVSKLTKSGGYTAEDPNASFYAAFFADKQVHLLPGKWEIAAFTDHGCDSMAGPPLRAAIQIVVTP